LLSDKPAGPRKFVREDTVFEIEVDDRQVLPLKPTEVKSPVPIGPVTHKPVSTATGPNVELKQKPDVTSPPKIASDKQAPDASPPANAAAAKQPSKAWTAFTAWMAWFVGVMTLVFYCALGLCAVYLVYAMYGPVVRYYKAFDVDKTWNDFAEGTLCQFNKKYCPKASEPEPETSTAASVSWTTLGLGGGLSVTILAALKVAKDVALVAIVGTAVTGNFVA